MTRLSDAEYSHKSLCTEMLYLLDQNSGPPSFWVKMALRLRLWPSESLIEVTWLSGEYSSDKSLLVVILWLLYQDSGPTSLWFEKIWRSVQDSGLQSLCVRWKDSQVKTPARVSGLRCDDALIKTSAFRVSVLRWHGSQVKTLASLSEVTWLSAEDSRHKSLLVDIVWLLD